MRFLGVDVFLEFSRRERWLAIALIAVSLIAGGLCLVFKQIGRPDGPLVTPAPQCAVPPPGAPNLSVDPEDDS